MNQSDVLIIGGGLTGYIAAYELCKKNIPVKMIKCGFGASPGVSGFNIPGVEKGDSIEKFKDDTKISGRNQGNDKLVNKLCTYAYQLEEYLENIGFQFDRNEDGSLKTRKALGSTFGRVVGKGNVTGPKILKIVREKLKKNKYFSVLDNVRALRLISQKDEVYGVFAYDEKRKEFINLYSKAVLLANGGFAGIYPFTSNSKEISGDGAAMALDVGCTLVDMEFVQFEPSSAIWPLAIKGKGMITTLFYEGAIMTNGKGERFMLKYGPEAECVNKDVLSLAIEKEILAGNASPHGGIWFDTSGVDEKRLYEAYEPFIQRYKNVGIDLTKEPIELGNAAHTSLGGVKIDDNCRTSIKGLYVAGEAAGNIHGANRIGGSAGTETMVFGQIAAAAIKEDLKDLEPLKIDYHYSTEENKALKKEELENYHQKMQKILGESVGVYRNGENLERASIELNQLLDKVTKSVLGGDNETDYQRIRLENDLMVAIAWVKAAEIRRDSCGCHQRSDYPSLPQKNYRTEVKMLNKKIKVSKVMN
jgi:fumarate reductase (CoM/CoB) subunit A